MLTTSQMTAWASGHAVLLAAAAAAALAVLVLVRRIARAARAGGRDRAISGLINVAALLATSVQASGMWKFFGATMGLPVGFRVVLFSFMEIALLACGLRARANVEEGGDAGIDGVLVWALALASGVMSSTDAASFPEALMRVLVSVVVAALWTRDLMAAKKMARAAGGKRRSGPVRWRITPERVFVFLRLADAVDTDVSTVEAGRRVARYLKATDRLARPTLLRLLTLAGPRAYRGRMKLIGDALRHGDPTQVHERLSKAAFADAMTRLGIAPETQDESSETESEQTPEPSQTAELITPRDSEFAEVIASLPPVPVESANGRKRVAAASRPARRQASVTARVGVDRDSVAQAYRESVEQGDPLSSRALACRFEVSQSTAARIIADVRAEDPAA